MLQDLRYGVRTMALRPLVTALTVALLAIGIAASVAVFCLTDAIIWNPTPFRDPDQLVHIRSMPDISISIRASTLEAWNARAQIMTATYTWTLFPAVIGSNDRTESASIGRFDPGLLSELGIRIQGRDFNASDVGRRLVILSHDVWKSQFDLASDAIGRSLSIEGLPYTVVGIVPAGVRFPFSFTKAWVPSEPAAPPFPIRAIGRLRPGVSFEQAAQFTRSSSTALIPRIDGPAIHLAPLVQSDPRTRQSMRIAIAAVVCLLLIAIANAGNLLLAEVVRRNEELTIRRSLGAGSLALVRQLLVETTLRCVAAALVGFAVSVWLLKLAAVRLPTIMAYSSLRPIALDWRAALFAIGLSMVAACGAALIPCAYVVRANIRTAIQGAPAHTTTRTRLRDTLTIGQLAASLVLLAAAALLVNGFIRLLHVNPGFGADGLSVVTIYLPERQLADRVSTEVRLRQLRSEARAIPGVTAVTTADGVPPMISYAVANDIQAPEGIPLRDSTTPVAIALVDEGYFETIKLSLIAGQVPSDAPAGPPFPAVITQSLADRVWPGRDAIGKQFRLDDAEQWLAVAGIVPDLRFGSIDYPFGALCIFVPRSKAHAVTRAQFLIVRSKAAPASLARELQAVVHRAIPGAAVQRFATVGELIATENSRVRFATELLSALAFVGSGLAALGVYGAFWCTVRQRRREIGIRLAIGAEPRRIVRMVLTDSTRLVLIAVAVGAPAAFAAAGALKPLLFEVSPVDPATFLFVCVGLTAVALAAAYGPARHASRIDPVEILRAE
jgi:putative ABC transport system permease protein